ncbi:MAG: hypothetical protein JWN44_6543, partial [Myxococcales bacterium]|nr:hypothetical protein [Myxococcales bacterium]
MRFYHKLALVALLSGSVTAGAQPQRPAVPAEQDVDDDEGPPPPQARQVAPQQNDGMPPRDPRAYQQAPQVQEVQQYGYMGPHPVPYESGQGFCYEGGAHFHEYPPFDQYLFREQGGWFYFVGDAADFGYQQQMWGYNGHHPIPAGYGGSYCFIDWPHRHHYAPPPSLAFNFVGGYYVYGGPWDPWYWRMRPQYASYYGGYYRRSYYGGIYWRTRPSPIYRSQVVIGAPGVYRPGATVIAPGGGRLHVVGPPRPYAPGPHVVGAPRPYAPGPTVVGPPRPYA